MENRKIEMNVYCADVLYINGHKDMILYLDSGANCEGELWFTTLDGSRVEIAKHSVIRIKYGRTTVSMLQETLEAIMYVPAWSKNIEVLNGK